MDKIKASLTGNIVSSNSPDAFMLQSKSFFGEPSGGKIVYTFSETLFLLEKGKMEVFSSDKPVSAKKLFEKFRKSDKKIGIKYPVFRDLRQKGYIVKTGMKFGAEFRVYPRGSSPNTAHAKWLVFTDSESKSLLWSEFAAKNRVAHSTKKKLLLAIVDDEEDISYYEINWIKT